MLGFLCQHMNYYRIYLFLPLAYDLPDMYIVMRISVIVHLADCIGFCLRDDRVERMALSNSEEK